MDKIGSATQRIGQSDPLVKRDLMLYITIGSVHKNVNYDDIYHLVAYSIKHYKTESSHE